ncbi:SIMPL domain-containing protein [Planctomycetes bacterium TBK1r]|uniref:Oxidative stress defense protein n=1 Tax=Stieleria magnilauensis TaxID=2527963 RepID=A0ABX5Y3A0_9BACT|nr:hypothetical protein TBK1r_64660 [Planctomycetes bacterium TBK1r]
MKWDATRMAPNRFLRTTRLAGIVLAIGLLTPAITVAQSSSMPEGIVARGTAVVAVEPSALRLTMSIQAQGKDAKSAVRSLAAHKERVRKELGEMNADTDSIQFTSTQLSSGGNENSEQRQYMQMMQMMQRQMGQAAPDMDSVPTVYTATTSLKVDWPLPTKDADALSLLPQGLRDQISQRDFKGEKNKPEIDEESLEKMKEMQAMMDENYGYSIDSSNSGGPNILFVGKISDEQRREAMKSAIEKAKKSAAVTAEALGVKLGKLKTLWPTENGGSSGASSYSAYMASEMYWSYDEEEDGEVGEDITANAIDGLRFQVSVFAVYDFE